MEAQELLKAKHSLAQKTQTKSKKEKKKSKNKNKKKSELEKKTAMLLQEES